VRQRCRASLNADVRGPVGYPNLLRRYLSSVIDVALILGLFVLSTRTPLIRVGDGSLPLALLPILVLLYEPIFVRYGCTLGQLVMSIRVRTFPGVARVPVWRGMARNLAKYALGWLSFMLLPMQRQRRALHDLFAKTVVLEASATAAQPAL